MWDQVKDYLKMEQCKNGYLYKVLARNTYLGIYCEKEQGFIYLREKLNHKFLDVERHWDYNERGTCKPIEELEFISDLKDYVPLLVEDATNEQKMCHAELFKILTERIGKEDSQWMLKFLRSPKTS